IAGTLVEGDLPGGRLLLSVVSHPGLEREPIDRIVEVVSIGTSGAVVVANFDALVGSDIHIDLSAGADKGVEILGQDDAAGSAAGPRGETIELVRRTVCDRRLLGEWDCRVARQNGVAAVLDLGNGSLVSGIKNLHAAELGVGLASGCNQTMLARIGFELVHVAQFADDRVLGAGLVALPSQINNVAADILGGVRSLQSTGNVIRVGQELLRDKPRAVQISISRRGELHLGIILAG